MELGALAQQLNEAAAALKVQRSGTCGGAGCHAAGVSAQHRRRQSSRRVQQRLRVCFSTFWVVVHAQNTIELAAFGSAGPQAASLCNRIGGVQVALRAHLSVLSSVGAS